eukprot:5162408-Pleurochrysis_carterae.AAC.3
MTAQRAFACANEGSRSVRSVRSHIQCTNDASAKVSKTTSTAVLCSIVHACAWNLITVGVHQSRG